MNNSEKLQLQKMIQANDAENNTHLIRKLKHSKKILEDVDELLKLKRDYSALAKSNPESFDSLCTSKCIFLFNNYTDIYNKVLKDEINLQILERLLNVLYSIEEGDVDQHEGSFEVGKLLKSIYIDSALKKADKINELHEKKEQEKPIKPISLKEFKKQKN